MKTPERTRRDGDLELNLTSMIDVIFLLLIFFVFTSDFKEPEKRLPTNLSLPGAIARDRVEPQERRDLDKVVARVFLAPGGRAVYSVNGERVANLAALESTLEALRELDPNVPVVIAPERDVPLESALDVYDVSRRVGLGRVQFAASAEALAR